MTKRNKLSKAQEALKQRVLTAYTKRGGFRYIPSNWDKNLWKKKTDDIYDYIDSRFRKQWLEVANTYERIDKKKTLASNEQKFPRINNKEGDCIEMPHTITFDGEI